ncbi:hypothetical protein BV326_00437 [Pseudomonas syringae pv. actinidiae]|uniref:hypothetical protein n=1 Tax=Pseudomonas syringae TaxID=317 RepID=UPI000A257484|nr:hypothetical protein [Pseudomonas syringae]OSR76140.1 hypothetical protein BV326_00437 [Pseudomonas syringae pv. actinidiae]
MIDAEKVLRDYRLVAETLRRIEDTNLLEDPDLKAQVKELRIAMAELNAMLDRLYQVAGLHDAVTRRSPPRLSLVKCSPPTQAPTEK